MITKTFNVLDVEDVERIVSEFVGREVKIGEMHVELVDVLPGDALWSEELNISSFCMVIYIILDDSDEEHEFAPLQDYLPDGALIPEKDFFNFDTKLFASYDRYIDTSD